MRKEKMLTRTVKSTVYEIEMVNRETHEFRSEQYEVAEEKAIKSIVADINDEGIEAVISTKVIAQNTALYGMPLSKFMEIAKRIDKTPEKTAELNETDERGDN